MKAAILNVSCVAVITERGRQFAANSLSRRRVAPSLSRAPLQRREACGIACSRQGTRPRSSTHGNTIVVPWSQPKSLAHLLALIKARASKFTNSLTEKIVLQYTRDGDKVDIIDEEDMAAALAYFGAQEPALVIKTATGTHFLLSSLLSITCVLLPIICAHTCTPAPPAPIAAAPPTAAAQGRLYFAFSRSSLLARPFNCHPVCSPTGSPPIPSFCCPCPTALSSRALQ